MFTEVQINELIEHLNGSCKTLEEGIKTILGEEYTENDLSGENQDQIDQEIFLCHNCGWWYEVEAQGENGDCEDCEED